ncbi:hypothetical protein [Pseudoduganella albidiflava]|uniref:Outer membrane beta-barrel protein n=1 Tax=Pseudoduganella albidiflava TaxID=321983 RepID=A0A411WZK8_9BURK|nr:hypothetical protein [Pseudoduganella albidiflava]QBI02141.1 hypothetical protein EYF70_15715 [Pseudoduganella albidiflava]GGY60213.1 hypothetical protein GCM10007387_48530 [Pseudoduganella albidiflava]
MTLALLPLAAQADRPLVTDDAVVLSPGTCQVEASASRGPGQRWLAPGCSVAEHWEAGIGVGNVRSGGKYHRAIVIGAKAVLRPLSEEGIGVGAAVSEQRIAGPEASRDQAVSLIVSVPLAQWARAHVNTGAVRHGISHQRAATWAAALEATRGRGALTLETFGERGASRGWQAGGRWTLVKDVLDADAGYGELHDLDGRRRFATVGLTYTFQR